MSAKYPERDLVDYLDANIAALTKGTNLFWGAEKGHDSIRARDSVYIVDSGGPQPLRTMGQPSEIRYVYVRVRIRSGKESWTRSTALAIMDLVQGGSVSGYLDINMLDPGFQSEGIDGNDNIRRAANIQMVYDG